MGMSSGAAFIAAIVAVLFLLKIARDELENTQQEMERESKGCNPSGNSEKISEKEDKEDKEDTNKESVAEEQLMGSSKTTNENSENEFNLTSEQAEAIYRLASGASFIGFIFVVIHIMSRILSTGISLIDGVLSFAFFCFCSYAWMKCTEKMNDAKRKLEKEKEKEKE